MLQLGLLILITCLLSNGSSSDSNLSVAHPYCDQNAAIGVTYSLKIRVGQNRIHTLYMNVYLVISLP